MKPVDSCAKRSGELATQRAAASLPGLGLNIPSGVTAATELDGFSAALQDWNAMARMQGVVPEGVSSRRRSPGMKAGLDFCSSLKCNEAHAATEALLTSLRSTSKDLERSLKLVNRQIGRLQKEVDARRKVQMERAMEEVKALMARYGLKPKDLAELEEQIGDGVTNVGTTPSSRNRAPALSEAA